MIAVLYFAARNIWWILPLLLFFGDAVLEILGGILSVVLAPFALLYGARQRQRAEVDRLRYELLIARTERLQDHREPPVHYPGDQPAIPARRTPQDLPVQDPGTWDPPLCHHDRVVPARAEATGELVGWVCTNTACGKEFPPDSNVVRS